MRQLYQLVEFVQELKLEELPEQVVEAAEYCLIDTISSALGAADNPLIQSIVKSFCAIDGASEGASLWGYGRKVPVRTAVFLNGMMGHVLELDDVHTGSKAHIGTVVIPAAWALAEERRCTGKELLEAVICGYEVMARIGKGFGVITHRMKGWHVTSTAGTFGAAAACAKLLGLNTQETLYALGLAGTQSFGTWAFLPDGTTNKILHPGKAALNGLDAALLSQAGMTGPPHILDSADGALFPAMSDDYSYEAVSEHLGQTYEILNMDKKPYPCCRSTHCAIDGAIQLCRDNEIAAEQVEHVEVRTYGIGYRQCGKEKTSRNPVLPSDAKFSTPYTVSCAIRNHRVGIEDFLPEAIACPQTRELMKHVMVEEDPDFTKRYPEHWGCSVTIVCKDGKRYFMEIPDASGSVHAPLTKTQIWEKVDTILGRCPGRLPEDVRKELLVLERLKQLPRL